MFCSGALFFFFSSRHRRSPIRTQPNFATVQKWLCEPDLRMNIENLGDIPLKREAQNALQANGKSQVNYGLRSISYTCSTFGNSYDFSTNVSSKWNTNWKKITLRIVPTFRQCYRTLYGPQMANNCMHGPWRTGRCHHTATCPALVYVYDRTSKWPKPQKSNLIPEVVSLGQARKKYANISPHPSLNFTGVEKSAKFDLIRPRSPLSRPCLVTKQNAKYLKS